MLLNFGPVLCFKNKVIQTINTLIVVCLYNIKGEVLMTNGFVICVLKMEALTFNFHQEII